MEPLIIGEGYPIYRNDDGSFVTGWIRSIEGNMVWVEFESKLPFWETTGPHKLHIHAVQHSITEMIRMRQETFDKCKLMATFEKYLADFHLALFHELGEEIQNPIKAQLDVAGEELLKALLRRQPLADEIEASSADFWF